MQGRYCKVQSPVHHLLEKLNGTFETRFGYTVCTEISGKENEYRFVRENVGLTDFSFVQKYRCLEEDSIYYLDEILPANIANIRYGRVLHTFLPDSDGRLLSDIFVANNDEEIILLCENCTDFETVHGILGNPDQDSVSIDDITNDFALFSLDGPMSWAVMRDLFSSDILGMPYLAVEPNEMNGIPVTLFRTGKTGEFGYLIMVASNQAETAWQEIHDKVLLHNGGVCGLDVFDLLKLDGRFFNINREGKRVRDPLICGLQWMIDFEKDGFYGSEAILKHRAGGLKRKVLGILGSDTDRSLSEGTEILVSSQKIGEIITAEFSYVLQKWIALAVVDCDFAYAGLNLTARDSQGEFPICSVSMPPFIPKSLSIKLDEV
jgi:glycine cleavage system T protein (aminomethyltransferase)